METEQEIHGLVTSVFGELVEVRVGSSEPAPAFQSRGVGGVVVGDRVTLESVPAESGEISWKISGFLPRTRCLWRATRRRKSQLIVANVDRFSIVAAVEPPLKPGLIDRYLVAAEWQSIPSSIILNKIDLEGSGDALQKLKIYSRLGYAVYPLSALTGEGIEIVEESFSEGLTVLVGHSGVGKSAILNRIVPDADLKIRDLSEATGKGRHTTSVITAHQFKDGIVVDTPGIREFGLVDIPPEHISSCFVEIRDIEGECRFGDCSHADEPGCAVRSAVEKGTINRTRYESYLRIRESIMAGER